MLFRSVFPDELGRAQSLLEGHPVPPQAIFLVGVKEIPVERIVVAIPWWKAQSMDSDHESLNFHFTSSGLTRLDEEDLETMLAQLEECAREHQLSSLNTDFSLPEQHPFYRRLCAHGFEISQTDRYFSIPGTTTNKRCVRLYQRAKSKIPPCWKVESIRGHAPEKIFDLVKEYNLMSPQQFQQYWNTTNLERFEENYSCVVEEEGQIIGAFLVTQRGADELHVHVDVVRPERRSVSGLVTMAMRNFMCSACSPGFPVKYTSRADSKVHLEGGNTPLRYEGGVEHESRHFLRKALPALHSYE